MAPSPSLDGPATLAKMKVMASTDATPGSASTSATRGGPNSWVTVASSSPPMASVKASGASAVRRAPAASVRIVPVTTATIPVTTSTESHRRRNVARTLNTTALTRSCNGHSASPSTALADRTRGCQHPLAVAWHRGR